MGLTAPRPEPDAVSTLRTPPRCCRARQPLAIVRLLAAGPLEVTEIANELGISVANTSHHLGRLRQAHLVTSRRDGTRITTTLAGPHVLALCLAACETAPPPGARAGFPQ